MTAPVITAPVLKDSAELAGRLLLGLLFVLEVNSKLQHYGLAVNYMAAYGLPALLLPPAIVLELGGGLMIMAGWQTRIAAAALAAFCAATALIFHTKFSDLNQLAHFEKDLALAGAFLVIWAKGAGAWSLDALWRKVQ